MVDLDKPLRKDPDPPEPWYVLAFEITVLGLALITIIALIGALT